MDQRAAYVVPTSRRRSPELFEFEMWFENQISYVDAFIELDMATRLRDRSARTRREGYSTRYPWTLQPVRGLDVCGGLQRYV